MQFPRTPQLYDFLLGIDRLWQIRKEIAQIMKLNSCTNRLVNLTGYFRIPGIFP